MPECSQTGRSAQALLDLYRATHYDLRMPGGERCTVRIGQSVPLPIGVLLSNTESSFLVSACNPRSFPIDVTENRQRMRDLLAYAKAEKLDWLPGVGHIPGSGWREAFLLLAGSDIRKIDMLACRLEQNAVVHICARRPPRLRVYQRDWRLDSGHTDDIEWVVDTPARTQHRASPARSQE